MSEISHTRRSVVGITGEICAGKDTLAHFVATELEKEGRSVSVLRTSDILREIFGIIGVESKRIDFHNMTEFLRHHYGEDILSQIMKRRLITQTVDNVIWVGLRSPHDIEVLSGFPSNKLVFVEAAAKERFRRLKSRGENIDDYEKTWEQFLQDNERSTERTICSFRAQADLVIANADSHLDEAQQLLLEKIRRYSSSA